MNVVDRIHTWLATDRELDECDACRRFVGGRKMYGNGTEIVCAVCLRDPVEHALFLRVPR